MTAEDGTSHTGKVYHYYKCFNRKLHKEQCNKSNITKEKMEDLVFGKTVEYVLKSGVIDKLAVAVTDKFNEGLQKSDTLALLEKEQKQVQKAIDGFLSAIAAGIVTKSTKEKLLELERQNDELESKIAVEKARQIQPLDYEKVKAFLTYFSRKQYSNGEEKNEFFNSFLYRVVLFDDYVYIFYNTSPQTPLKFKLDKDDLTELREYRENRKSTRFQPLGFKLGALGGARVSVFERSGEAWAADNLPLLPYYHYSHLRRSHNRKPSRYEDCRNATRNLKDFARFYDTIPHKKSSTVFPADFATSSVERKFGSFRAQDKNPFLPHLTACTYLTIQVHKFPF